MQREFKEILWYLYVDSKCIFMYFILLGSWFFNGSKDYIEMIIVVSSISIHVYTFFTFLVFYTWPTNNIIIIIYKYLAVPL